MCISDLLANNRRWAETMAQHNPQLFSTLAEGQSPKYLWLGCSDSRVPATQVLGLQPGDVFVHRNIANLIKHEDISSQSVLQYAVDVLQVEHIIVCGHYGCGGVKVAMGQGEAGVIDYWLRSVKDSCVRNEEELAAYTDEEARFALFLANSQFKLKRAVRKDLGNAFAI